MSSQGSAKPASDNAPDTTDEYDPYEPCPRCFQPGPASSWWEDDPEMTGQRRDFERSIYERIDREDELSDGTKRGEPE